jgi:uncharacterized PurR-regulated membrane protein YhhQ (DUF165 family)
MGVPQRPVSARARPEESVMVIILFTAFIATVIGANWSLAVFGIVPIGFGLSAPAGVFSAGLAFTCRDLLHEAGGRRYVIAAIICGAALSALLEDARIFAVASGVAFLASETADLLIYVPLRQRGWLRAVAASNIIGFIVDSMLFLWIAFGSFAFLPGQLVGKGGMTALAIVLLLAWRHHGILSRHTDRTLAR